MGYPVEMIGKDTRLYGIIGSSAIEHKLEHYFNRYFQEMDVDCKAMPLNIREDDLGFFLNGLKDSKIAGVYIEEEYQQLVYNLLKPEQEETLFAQACDTIDIENNRYRASMSIGKALDSLSAGAERIIIVGNTPHAKSYLFHLTQNNPTLKEIHFASPYIEEMIELIEFLPDTISHDIHRVVDGSLTVNADMMVNFTPDPVKTQTPKAIDIKADFEKIIDKIAEIKTKEWADNG